MGSRYTIVLCTRDMQVYIAIILVSSTRLEMITTSNDQVKPGARLRMPGSPDIISQNSIMLAAMLSACTLATPPATVSVLWLQYTGSITCTFHGNQPEQRLSYRRELVSLSRQRRSNTTTLWDCTV